MIKNLVLCFVILWAYSTFGNTEEIEFESPLMPIEAPINDLAGSIDKNDINLPSKSDIMSLVELHSPVRSQKSRGTCTMFTSIGMVEHLLIKKGIYNAGEIDLSEEWMEYIIMKDKQNEGSSTSRNMKAILNHGVVFEKTWPYLGKRWRELTDSILANETCGHLKGQSFLLQSCLLGHRDPTYFALPDSELKEVDPEFYVIREEARELKSSLIDGLYKKRKSYKLKYVSSIKKLINKGQSVIMGTKLYYGSWNSSKTEKLNIQERDKTKWYQGIVTYPEPNSVDRRISGEKGGGHSVIIVGYDDDKIVTSRMLMEDGTWKEFTYKGVYYFKNSWGVKGFGKRFELDGVTLPGYGMITQKYAHEFGNFFRVN